MHLGVDFFADTVQREVNGVIHSLHLHNIGLAPWQQLGCMCCRAFCVSKFEVGGPAKELWATLRGIFCSMEIPGVPVLTSIVFTSIRSVSFQDIS